MNLSRRQFFFQLQEMVSDEVSERIGGVSAPWNIEEPAWPEWIDIGPIADYPPGAARVLSEHDVIVSSEPEGIRVVAAKSAEVGDLGPHRPVRMQRNGRLSFHRTAVWPAGSGLSILTGEQIQLSDLPGTEGSHHE